MPQLPPSPDLDQLRRLAKERLRAIRSGDDEAKRWIGASAGEPTLSAVQLRLARDVGFPSWAKLRLEVARRQLLDGRDAGALTDFVEKHPELATADLTNWSDHPLGASPLGYLAMARFDTTSGVWRDVADTGAAANVLIAAGAPVDGGPDDRETPLITAASYGDADIAAVLIAAGADIDAVAHDDAGGVPGGSALLHAAVFGNTEVIDVLAEAGAQIRSLEEAAAVGNLDGWDVDTTTAQTRLRALIMAADHQRIDVIDALVAAGTGLDDQDEAFGRQALRLAASNGRVASVTSLVGHGADRTRRDASGFTALDHCRHSRRHVDDMAPYDVIEAILTSEAPAAEPA